MVSLYLYLFLCIAKQVYETDPNEILSLTFDVKI